MKQSDHISEEALIELHLNKEANAVGVRQHLEGCAQCSKLSDSIVETLRFFSAASVPAVDLDRQWQRMRGALPKLYAEPPVRLWASRSRLLAAVVCATVSILAVNYHSWNRLSGSARMRTPVKTGRPGKAPVAPARARVVEQLNAAERLLTTVNHTPGPLDAATREEAHELLQKNGLYSRMAREADDAGMAALLDDLGRLLINIDHASGPNDSARDLRREWNTEGLLLDVRILQQAEGRKAS